jgi:hypothetical protein
VANGYKALGKNKDGQYNVAIGALAMENCTTGDASIAIGIMSLRSNVGTNNIAVGHQVMSANTSGERNIAIGTVTLGGNTTGTDNVAIGYSINPTGNHINTTAIGSNIAFTKDSTFYVKTSQIRNYADSATAYADGIRSGCIYRVGSSLRIMW